MSAELALGAYGWHLESGVHILRLILSGVFKKLPGLQLISGHWGEMVPFYLSRLDFVLTKDITGLSQTITEAYRQHVTVTPSGLLDRNQFTFIHNVLGADRIIWSTDYPHLTMDGVREFIAGLPVSQEERELIFHGNAERLLRLSNAFLTT